MNKKLESLTGFAWLKMPVATLCSAVIVWLVSMAVLPSLQAADARPKLVVTAKDVRPKSVQIVTGTTANAITFRYANKSPEEINSYLLRPVQVMADGKVVAVTSIGAGLSQTSKGAVGLVLTFRTPQEAQAALRALAANPAK